MKLIVALGNPDQEYKMTRHNIGWIVLDEFLKKNDFLLEKNNFNGVYTKQQINSNLVIFAKPLTYMNLSGNFIKEICNFYKISFKNVLVIHDDKDIDLGKYQLKSKGSSAGHNGVKNIIHTFGTDEFYRLRIGVKNGQITNIKEFVLQNFKKEEIKVIIKNLNNYFNVINDFIR